MEKEASTESNAQGQKALSLLLASCRHMANRLAGAPRSFQQQMSDEQLVAEADAAIRSVNALKGFGI